jgi:hypothetical protein
LRLNYPGAIHPALERMRHISQGNNQMWIWIKLSMILHDKVIFKLICNKKIKTYFYNNLIKSLFSLFQFYKL